MAQQEFTVQTVGAGFATVTPDLILDDVVIDGTPLTRTVFRTEVHTNGIRGWLINQKKSASDQWEDTKKIDFRRLRSGEGASIELSTEALAKLAEQYKKLQSHLEEHGLNYGKHTYVSGEKGKVVIVDSKSIAASINSVLEVEDGEEFWNELAENHPALLRRLAYGSVHEDRNQQLIIFKKCLDNPKELKSYAAAQGINDSKDEKIWQHYFEQNPWIFGYGLDYSFMNVLQREATVGGATVGGQEQEFTDFLLGTNEFTVLVELKTAETPLFHANKNRAGSWRLSNDIILAESQILEQKASLQSFAESNPNKMFDDAGNKIKHSTLNPKTILIIGNTKELDLSDTDLERQIKSHTLELHRRELTNIKLMTYDELYDRASHILAINEKESVAATKQKTSSI